MSDLTIFPADIAEMSVSQLAALPAAQKHEIDKNLDAAIDWLKKARTKFEAALDQCYGEQARAALRESESFVLDIVAERDVEPPRTSEAAGRSATAAKEFSQCVFF